MFSLKEFVKSGFVKAVGSMADYAEIQKTIEERNSTDELLSVDS
jgi:hypothetical protein